MQIVHHTAEADRVRANTASSINSRIDAESEYRLARYGNQTALSTGRPIEELDREWDVERVIEVETSSIALVGLLLSVLVNKKLLIVPGLVSAMLFLHATHGFYPLLPFFRRLGLRTRNEIDRERYALKAIRGDFSELISADAANKAELAWEAVLK